MYTITMDGQTLHDPRLGEGYVVLEPILNVEIDKAGTLEFSVAPPNVCYSDLEILKNRICVYKNDVCIWEGRPLNIEVPYNLIKRVTCEGRIAELKDAPYTLRLISKYGTDRATQTTIDGETFVRADGNLPALYQAVFERYNAFIDDPTKEVVLGNMDIPWQIYGGGRWEYTGTNTFSCNPDAETTFYDLLFNGHENPDSNLGWDFPKITDEYYNAHILPRYRGEDVLIIDILRSVDASLADQVIRFGENLLDITQFIDSEGAYSVIYPIFKSYHEQSVGKYLDGTVDPINETTHDLGGKLLENETYISMFGRVIKPVTIIYSSQTDIATQEQRENLAAIQMESDIKNIITVELTALDLSLLGVDVDSIELFKRYEIVSPPHNFDEIYQCVAITHDLDEPQNDVYTFGASRQTLTNWVTEQIAAAKAYNSTTQEAEE